MSVNEQLVDRPFERSERLPLYRSLWLMAAAHPVVSIFILAFSVRLVAIFALDLFPDSYVFAIDNTTYSGMASAVVTGAAETWDAGTRGLYDATFTFTGPVTLIYALTDSSELAARIYVALLGAGTAALVTRLGMECLPRVPAAWAGLAVAFLPSQVLWSSLLLKDAAVWVVLAGMAVAVALASRRTGARMIVWVLVAASLLLALGYLRPHTTVVAAWALGIAGFAGLKTQRFSRGALALSVAVVVPWLVGLGLAGSGFVAGVGSLEYRRAANALGAQSAFVDALSPEQLSGEVAPPPELLEVQQEIAQLEERLARISGTDSERAEVAVLERIQKRVSQLKEREAALAAAAPTTDLPDAATTDEGFDNDLAHLPKGLSVMLLEPYPWSRATSPTFQLARGEAFFWYPLLLLAVVGLWGARSHLNVMAFPLLAGGGMLLVYALAEGNIGTAFRHRGELVWVVALLAGIGLQQVRLWRQSTQPAPEEG